MKEALTFDDVQILPQYSEVITRTAVSLAASVTLNYRVGLPVIASPMDTICELSMAVAMLDNRCAGAMHRFCTIQEASNNVRELALRSSEFDPVIGTIGVIGDYQERTNHLLHSGANIIMIDVAHGDHLLVQKAIDWLNGHEQRDRFDIIAGNVATAEGAQNLENWGVDAIRVGIGGGSVCETRIRTGIGVPQLQSIIDCAEAVDIPIIADGGIRTPGDVAKALAAGASTVMLGSMLSGTDETPGEVVKIGNEMLKKYRGSASLSAKVDNGMGPKYVEGASTLVPLKGSVKDVLASIKDGLQSAFSYVGAHTISGFQQRAKFVRITNSGIVEAHPHALRK